MVDEPDFTPPKRIEEGKGIPGIGRVKVQDIYGIGIIESLGKGEVEEESGPQENLVVL